MNSKKIPDRYLSGFLSEIKEIRKNKSNSIKDFSPTELDFGQIKILLPRYFGLCFGVENAIDIAYRTLKENPNKKIYLLSEMIHNPSVNADLKALGIEFIMDSHGKQLLDWEEISSEDIVIIPAFGTTLETERILKNKGLEINRNNTTCPFVTKVWKRASQLGFNNATVVIHGKHYHEETKATFSHSKKSAPSIVVRNIEEAEQLCKIILNEIPENNFYKIFEGKFSEGFDVKRDLKKIGVVNQTTMLAEETTLIADMLKSAMEKKYGLENLDRHFCDTKDTLCYATNNNQSSTKELLKKEADLAIVVGGFNSSNTSHLVELLETKFPVYFISSEKDILNSNEIKHYSITQNKIIITKKFFPKKENLKIILTSGASCPDIFLEEVLNKILSFFEVTKKTEEILEQIKSEN